VRWCQIECSRRKCEYFPSIAISSVWSSPLALHIEIYTDSHVFLAISRLLFMSSSRKLSFFWSIHTFYCDFYCVWICVHVFENRNYQKMSVSASLHFQMALETSELHAILHRTFTNAKQRASLHRTWRGSWYADVTVKRKSSRRMRCSTSRRSSAMLMTSRCYVLHPTWWLGSDTVK